MSDCCNSRPEGNEGPHCLHESSPKPGADLVCCWCGDLFLGARDEHGPNLPDPMAWHDPQAEKRRVSPTPRIPDGMPGIRDAEAPCEEFAPGMPEGRCNSDGHYLCKECQHYRRRCACGACGDEFPADTLASGLCDFCAEQARWTATP